MHQSRTASLAQLRRGGKVSNALGPTERLGGNSTEVDSRPLLLARPGTRLEADHRAKKPTRPILDKKHEAEGTKSIQNSHLARLRRPKSKRFHDDCSAKARGMISADNTIRMDSKFPTIPPLSPRHSWPWILGSIHQPPEEGTPVRINHFGPKPQKADEGF